MLRAAALLGLLAACGDDLPQADAGGSLAPLDALVDAYEAGALSRDAFRAAIAAYPDSDRPSELAGELRWTTLLTARPEPYRVTGDLTVAPGAILVIEEGAELVLDDAVVVAVEGRLYAVGSPERTIVIRGADGARYDTLALRGGPNQLVHVELEGGRRTLYASHPMETRTLVEGCRFDRWSSLAIGQLESANLHVLRSRFGYQTPADEELAEAIRTRGSGRIIIEECEFSRRRGYRDVLDLEGCLPGSWPLVLRNRFDGGEDDAIDLDGCSALVVGNVIRDFRPADLAVQELGVNGGGVTGDRSSSRPLIANNVIDGCYHAIGFKDGSQPILINNTIINSNIGIALYQSAVGRPMPHGVAINNVLWNNTGWLDGAANDVVLDGRWWAGYNQVDEVQATLDARSNITATLDAPYPGEGNLADDPRLELVDGIPVPGAGSPALDSALGDLALDGLPRELVLELLATDVRGVPRAREGDLFRALDRGAAERPTSP